MRLIPGKSTCTSQFLQIIRQSLALSCTHQPLNRRSCFAKMQVQALHRSRSKSRPAQDEVALATQLLKRLSCLDAAHQSVQIVGVVLECPCSISHACLVFNQDSTPA